MSYYPVFLDLTGKRCLVIGGGEVGLRKTRSLLHHGAQVEVISPEICVELDKLAAAGRIKAGLRRYSERDLEAAFLVVAATSDSELNKQIALDAKKRNLLINVVDGPQHSNFIVPASLHRGDLTVAVSTGGKSPALARKVRDALDRNFDEEYGILVLMIDEVRRDLKSEGVAISADRWQQALQLDGLLDLLRRGEREKAKRKLLGCLGVTID